MISVPDHSETVIGLASPCWKAENHGFPKNATVVLAYADSFEFEDVVGGAATPEMLRASIEANGYVVLKSVFSANEIQRMREQSRRYLLEHGVRQGLGRTRSNVAADVEDLAWVFSHDRILQAVHWTLDDPGIVYTGHSDAHMNMVAGWHKDSETRYGSYFSQPCIGAADCRVYKIGIYLQDHSQNATGLKVRRGSHKVANLSEGELVTIRSGIGDIVIFDVRISHCGDLPDPIETVLQKTSRVLKGANPNRQDPESFVRLREHYVRLRRTEQKMSLFFTFGVENKFTSDFANTNMRRQAEQIKLAGGTLRLEFPEGLASRLTASRVKLPIFDKDVVLARR